ncbi:hypothetical protein LEP1GSC062_3940 [Leptospira alexanderi serovar Manhao 3 str. L 60]|uniref:Ankyrin repeat protein n=1 Tax=Leptospira alexanderi serovar Manhao 3 str. L 60 TaxID=1049759 RepID=V6I0H4_9LEPT|nr:hypothetical protein LEP1GSC062_3940 [Leptospira alexanderi serovar Manhao 3 str. L 60]
MFYPLLIFSPVHGKFPEQGNLGILEYWLARVFDLPLCLIADTVLLPGTLPYFIYVKSGRPWSSGWYHGKYEQRVTSFRDQNPPYNALKSILATNDLAALQKFLKLYDVVALEKKINFLQQEDLLPYEHKWRSDLYSHKIGIIDYMASFFSTQTTYRKIVPKILNPGDRLEVVYTLYEEFRKDPILEKRYYDVVWKTCFSSGVLIENPKVLKKVLQEFSERKEISDLFEPIAQRYSEKEYKQFQDPFHDPYYSFNKAETQKFSEFWYNRVELLSELDKFLQKNPELQKEWKRTAWISAISSGVIAYRPPLLERAFREFPMETAKSSFSLFVAAYKSKNRQSIDIIVKNLKDADSFPLDQLHETNIQHILKYPNLLEKLLQTGWDPNLILEWEKRKFRGGKEFIEKEETSLLILSIQNDSVPMETIRILLKYGAKLDLGVKQYDHYKQEYRLVYPKDGDGIEKKLERANNFDDTQKSLKQKTLTEGPLKEFHTKYPIYSVLKSYAENQNVRDFQKTLAGIDLVPMEKEMYRLQKEYIVPTEIPREGRSGSDKTSLLGSVSSLAKVHFKYEYWPECWASGKYAEAVEIQKIYYNSIRNDEDLKRSFLENLKKNGAFWEEPIFSEQIPKLLSGDRIDWSGFDLENLVQHGSALELLMKQDSKMETGLKQKIVAVSLVCGNPKSAEVALKYFSGNDYQNFSSEYVNFLLGDSRILELFLKKGMNPNSLGKKEHTVPSGCPLLLTALASRNSWDGRERLVQLLLKYGANPNLSTEIISGKTQKTVSIYPLNFISGSDKRLLQILKASGADKNLLTPDSKEIGFGTYVCQRR